MNVKQYSLEDFKKLKKAGEITAQALDFLSDKIKPGITTNFIDNVVADFLKSKHATAAPLFYKGFPKSICTSVNHVVCHGIPSEKPCKMEILLTLILPVLLMAFMEMPRGCTVWENHLSKLKN